MRCARGYGFYVAGAAPFDDTPGRPRMVRIVEDLAGDWRRLDERIERLDRSDRAPGCQLRAADERARCWADHLQRDGGRDRRRDVFNKGRDFAAWLGLVPKQISTGDRTILGKISRRGNRYLPVLFVQAAWVVLIKPKIWERHGLKPWIEAARKRLHHNVLAIALAISWPASLGRSWPVGTSRRGQSLTLNLLDR